ncbi:MAG: hypothetical protein JRJ80_20715, partial [Deltaproteobacteria bacterium]|nr:hypothetical protein [Deltaproteobacteria bacterium]
MHCFSFSDREALRFAFVVLALVALFVVGCSESSSAPADGRFEPIQEATPIPRQTPEELGIEPFIGEAVVPNPTDPKNIPDHPILNNDGDSRIHNDHYNTGVYDRPGPTGPAIEVISHQLGSLTGICAMMAMLENGYVIASCFIGAAESGI